MDTESRERFLAHLERVRGPLTAYVRSLLWRGDGLSDALQVILMTAFEKYAAFEEGTDFRAWVFRIATLQVFNLNRKHGREEPSIPEGAEPVDPATALEREWTYEEILHDPDRLLDRMEDEVRAAVRRLPPNERAVLLLVSVGGFTSREAAEIMSIPHGSAMGYVGRARGRLREALAEYARTRGWARSEKGGGP